MGLLKWLRREAKGKLRLLQLLAEEELAIWRRLEESFPENRVVPLVPVGLIVEGGLPDEVAQEVVPFVVVDGSGWAVRALFYERSNGYHTLSEMGVACAIVEEVLSSPPAPEEEEGQKEAAEKGGEARAQEGGQEDAASSSAPPALSPSSPEGDEGKTATQDLATLWWRGEVDAQTLLLGQRRRRKEEAGAEVEKEAAEPSSPSPVPKRPEKRGQVGEAQGKRPREEAKEVKREEEKARTPKCPVCGSPMVLKVAKRGKNAGQEFWSCTRYPECKGTRPKK